MEEKKEKKEDTKKGVLVVSELPVQQLREVIIKDNTFEVVTVDEALSEILKSVREIKKAVV